MTSIEERLSLKQSIYDDNKKSGPYNAYFLWLIANRWKEAPKARYRNYPLIEIIYIIKYPVKLIFGHFNKDIKIIRDYQYEY